MARRQSPRRCVVEPLENRLLFAVDVALLSATTVDAHSISVTYAISGGAVSGPLKFDFYRNDIATADASMKSLGTQSIAATAAADLSVGTHTVTFLSGTTLTPDVASEYVLAVANADGAVAESS